MKSNISKGKNFFPTSLAIVFHLVNCSVISLPATIYDIFCGRFLFCFSIIKGCRRAVDYTVRAPVTQVDRWRCCCCFSLYLGSNGGKTGKRRIDQSRSNLTIGARQCLEIFRLVRNGDGRGQVFLGCLTLRRKCFDERK